ncbi:MAG: AAA ATPase [Trizodia sp. TS-e1964]|nr:MAG: AAA ATPase [Trizodia sp. TS-e1964]
MVSTVLGKRSRRTFPISDDSSIITSRAKRRAQIPVLDDEANNPFITQSPKQTARDVDYLQEDSLVESKYQIRESIPTKHTIHEGRIALSPAKSNTQFKLNGLSSDDDYKIPQLATPQTPRHRDALSKSVPVTPRHRVKIVGKPLTPRTPRTPITPGDSLQTIYSSARLHFTRNANPGRLVGRDQERKELHDFIDTRVESSSGGSIYISGPPGTGKSALVGEVVASKEENTSIRTAYVNCMTVKSSKDVFVKLFEALCSEDELIGGTETAVLQARFLPKKRKASGYSYVVTLDEMDQLLTLDIEILYTLFEWSMRTSSRLILIGIANALDLTDRFLPRLKSRNLKPELQPFLPYTAPQIASVITTKMKSLSSENPVDQDYVPFLHPAAIQLCSKKVAQQTGDLRKAFDICRRAIDLVETETKLKHQQQVAEENIQLTPSKTPLIDNINLASPGSPGRSGKTCRKRTLAQSLSTLTPENAPRVTIAHIARITSAVFGNGTSQRLQSLNLQQKAALCTLLALEKRKRALLANLMATPSKTNSAAPTVRSIFEAYSALCKRDKILHTLTNTEFKDVIGSLEAMSLVSNVDGKGGSFGAVGTPSKRGKAFGGGLEEQRRFASCVGEKELERALEGPGCDILRAILSGDGLA